jgi:hypothetical protein
MTRIHNSSEVSSSSSVPPSTAASAAASHQANEDARHGLPTAQAANVAATLATAPATQISVALGATPPGTDGGIHLNTLPFAPPPPPVFSTSFKGVLPPITDYRRITLKDLHTYRFYCLMPLASFSVRALLHPFSVIKTRMMATHSAPIPPAASLPVGESMAAASVAASSSIATPAELPGHGNGNMRSVVSHILRTEGPRALYSGFGVSVTSLIVGPVYMATLMGTKEYFENLLKANPQWQQQHQHHHSIPPQQPVNSSRLSGAATVTAASLIPFASGAFASCIAQCLGVPLDVIANKQMVGRTFTYTTDPTTQNGHANQPQQQQPPKSKHAFQIIQKIWRKQGIRGFYKGIFTLQQHPRRTKSSHRYWLILSFFAMSPHLLVFFMFLYVCIQVISSL